MIVHYYSYSDSDSTLHYLLSKLTCSTFATRNSISENALKKLNLTPPLSESSKKVSSRDFNTEKNAIIWWHTLKCGNYFQDHSIFYFRKSYSSWPLLTRIRRIVTVRSIENKQIISVLALSETKLRIPQLMNITFQFKIQCILLTWILCVISWC